MCERPCEKIPFQIVINYSLHCKKRLAIFPSPAGMSLTKLSLAGNKLYPAKESLVSDVPAGDGKIDNLFLQCTHCEILSVFAIIFMRNELSVNFLLQKWHGGGGVKAV